MKPAAAKRVKEALSLLVAVGIPREQQNERSALTLLALANLAPRAPWKDASSPLRRITQMMGWMTEEYGVRYAPNTRETIRRQTASISSSNTACCSRIPTIPSGPSTARIGVTSSPLWPCSSFEVSELRNLPVSFLRF